MKNKITNKIVFLLTIFISGCWDVENGEKIGTIVKISKQGAVISTYECELIRGGMNNGNGSFGKSFHFTIEKNELLPLVNKALDEQKEVKIKYHREYLVLPWRSESSNYFLDEVRII